MGERESATMATRNVISCQFESGLHPLNSGAAADCHRDLSSGPIPSAVRIHPIALCCNNGRSRGADLIAVKSGMVSKRRHSSDPQ